MCVVSEKFTECIMLDLQFKHESCSAVEAGGMGGELGAVVFVPSLMPLDHPDQ